MEVGLSIVELACSEKKLTPQSTALCIFSCLVCFASYEFFGVNNLNELKMEYVPIFFLKTEKLDCP